MKRITAYLLLVMTLALSQSIFAATESYSTTEWRPIAEITDLEKGIIGQTTRQSPDWVYKDAVMLTTEHDVVIKILLKDGTIKYYAAGEYKNIDIVDEDQSGGIKRTAPLTQKARALDIANEFFIIWVGKVGSELGTEDLRKADNLMFEFLTILNSDTIIANDIFENHSIMADARMIGAQGNRYLYAFEGLPIGPKRLLDFYKYYIVDSDFFAVEEDRPTDQEKIQAVAKIKIILNKHKEYARKDLFDFEEIKRLDPGFYESLTD